MAKLKKSRVVLEHDDAVDEDDAFAHDGTAHTFSTENDGLFRLDLPGDVYDEMGKPDHITVTIRRGDRLN